MCTSISISISLPVSVGCYPVDWFQCQRLHPLPGILCAIVDKNFRDRGVGHFHCTVSLHSQQILALKVLVATIDALGHFETG